MAIILIFEAVLIITENEESPAGSDKLLDVLIRFKYAAGILEFYPKHSASDILHL